MLEGVLPIKIVSWPVVERSVLLEEVLGGSWQVDKASEGL